MVGDFSNRLMEVILDYRASIEGGHFDEVDRDLGHRSWMEDHKHLVPGSIVDKAIELFDELQGGVANRDREAALVSIERIREWLQHIPLV